MTYLEIERALKHLASRDPASDWRPATSRWRFYPTTGLRKSTTRVMDSNVVKEREDA